MFADVKIVDGVNRSLICDLTRGYFHFIPTLMSNLIYRYRDDLESIDVNSLRKNESKNIINEYLEFLHSNEYVYSLDPLLVDNFIDLKLDYDYPFKFSNIVVNVSSCNYDDVMKLMLINIFKLTKNVGIVIDASLSVDNVKIIIDTIRERHVVNIELFVPNFMCDEVCLKINGLKLISLHKYEGDCYFDSIDYASNWPKLNLNITLFEESQKYNTYFNRKLYIDKYGNIKNSVEFSNYIDNIVNINSILELEMLIEKEAFKKYWHIHKELIDICKYCELRHMCVDNRIPVKRDDGSWYHTEECSYNPYISKWKNETDFLSLKECGVLLNENVFEIDKNKLKQVQREIWY